MKWPFILSFLLLSPLTWAAPVNFNKSVRPMLSDACFHCHGFDKSSRKGGLRLDLPEEALKPAKSGAIPIVPGKPEESEVMKRILSSDPEEKMPPAEAHKVLKPEQVEIFRRWIAEGAKYQEHWAYTPLVVPAVPGGASRGDAVDAFIRQELKAKGLDFAAPADPATLLRRLSLDLVGLPPTPQEVADFVKDPSPLAFGASVDRLLASPHFGERWAVWWLDLARFGDTVGFHGDQNHRVFPYRDYVVSSFNKNKSFGAFITEQLAGDLLPQPTTEQLVATGFNRLNMMTREGGAQPGEYLAKYGAERTRTVSNALLGSTFGCAECHDHKFDPISAKDFYSLQAFFADLKQWGVYSDYNYSPNPDLKGYTNDSPFPPEIQVESDYLKQRMARLEQEMETFAKTELERKPKLQEAFQAWQGELKAFLEKQGNWLATQPVVTSARVVPKGKKAAEKPPEPISEPRFTVGEDGTVHATSPEADDTSLTISPNLAQVATIKLEALPHADFKGTILRNGHSGSATVKLKVRHKPKDQSAGKAVGLYHAQASLRELQYDSGHEILGVQAGWITAANGPTQPHTAVYVLEQPMRLAEGDALVLDLPDNLLGHFRVSVSPLLQESGLQSASDPSQARVFLASTGEDGESLKKLRQLQREYLACRGGKAWTMVTEAKAPMQVRVLPRGNWMDATGEEVVPAVPHFLPNHPDAATRRLTRLDLANWLTGPQNPLTARATVNRIWKQFYGAGISSNLDDLGFQGDPPSHPELLDWLAAGFREGGWDFKALVKTMVSTRTYQQNSSLRQDVMPRDPNNRWLSSQNPRRLEAEFVRDNALAIAGLLQADLGGPSVKPYQPADYYEALQFPSRSYVAEQDERQWRRGLYMHWQRTFLHPMLANFDAPSRDECLANRVYSNTPQQALTLLNDPTFAEAALAFAARLLATEAVSNTDRLKSAFQLALGREPRDKETATLTAFLNKQLAHFQANAEDAKKLTSAGLKKVNPALPTAELAAWASTCRVVLNLHETITRY